MKKLLIIATAGILACGASPQQAPNVPTFQLNVIGTDDLDRNYSVTKYCDPKSHTILYYGYSNSTYNAASLAAAQVSSDIC